MKYLNFLQTVPLARVRHHDLPCYRAEGFGGAPVESWPQYAFFKQYLAGEQDAARHNFEQWYAEQLGKYHAVPKAQGGMYQGSLYLLVERMCGAPFARAAEDCKRAAIRERVLQRMRLLEDLRQGGYRPHRAERIDAVSKNGLVYLRGGHHRAAALAALGAHELPGVLVFPNRFVYTLFCLVRSIRHGHL